MKKIIFISAIIFLFSSAFCQVVINEYSASNLTSYIDNYDLEEDWIELYNTSSENIHLGGYYLSDNPDEPTKWTIPHGTNIPANGYKTFWCSGRDEGFLNSIHTSFKLKQTKEDPEHVVFSDPDGNIINDFQLQITQLEHSMGRSSDGADDWRIFPNPTKGESNEGSSYLSYAHQPEMNVEAGFHEGGIFLEISTEEADAEIYYTLDGNPPGIDSYIYSGGLWITSTQIVKAIVIPNEDNCCDVLPSFMTFNTYFINENHNLPVLSTSADQLTTLLNGNQGLRPHGTIEYFDSDGIRTDFGYGEYNKHGQDSWQFDQRSFDYIARDEMGYHDAIHEKLLTLSDREAFQRIIIRASGDDNYPGIDSSAHMRDVFIQKLANKHNLNLDIRRGERVVVYANGMFWGVYSIREKVSDSDYTKFYYDQDKYNIQYVMNWGNTWAQYGGSDAISDWNAITNYAEDNNLAFQSHYEYVTSQIDITSLVDYVLINSFVVCTDWINWNTSVWRGLDPDGGHQKWGFVLWDEDATFNHYINYTGIPNDDPDAEPCYPEDISQDPLSVIDLLNALMDNDEFMQYYNTRYMDLMNTAFKEEETISLIEEIEDAISHDMNHHFLRWGGYSLQWHHNVNKVKNFILDRIDYIPGGMNSCYELTGPYSLTLDVYPQNAGKIQINSIEIDNPDYPWTGDYHGEIEMLISATHESNFDHWEINNHIIDDLNAANISLMLSSDDTLRAVFTEQNTSDILVINEFMAANESTIADEAGDYEDWIEIYYNIPYSMNLDGYFLTDNLNNPSKWMFPDDVEISGEGYILIWADEDQEEGYLHTNFKLSSSGEEIGFFDPELNLIDQISFGSQSDDISYGRETDGTYSWQFFDNPTPNYSNSDNPCQTGDINCDNNLDIIDAVLMVNLVLEGEYESAGDLNEDGALDILDIIQLVNIILNNSSSSSDSRGSYIRILPQKYLSPLQKSHSAQ